MKKEKTLKQRVEELEKIIKSNSLTEVKPLPISGGGMMWGRGACGVTSCRIEYPHTHV